MEALVESVRACTLCAAELPLGPRPVLSVSPRSKIAIVGQAPGTKVHASGIPWDDASGKKLREWLGVDPDTFYNPDLFAIVPMGFCYPGKGKSGDLPPRKECAATWHEPLFAAMPELELCLLIGQYAQAHYLGNTRKPNLTETVRHFEAYGPRFFPLPHPSPRNRFWLQKNPWFADEVLPELRRLVGIKVSAF